VSGNGSRNRGAATVAVADVNGAAVGGVSVEGSFTGDWSGTVTATTDSNGQTTLQTPPVKNGTNFTFCVSSLAREGWTYDASANLENCDSTSSSSPVGFVTGRVTDNSTGSGITGAAVSTDTGQSTQTDSLGYYELSAVPAGSRTVTASGSGYTSASATLLVEEGQTATADFALAADTSAGAGTIKGTVTSTGGAKLRDVLVQTDTGHSALTNPGGQYTIQNVPAGTRTVTASRDGYASQTQTFELSSGQSLTVSFSLSPQ
jgi:hypothetical protein